MNNAVEQSRQVLTIHNRTSEAARLWVEPWGDCVEIAPNQSLVVVAEGPVGNGLEFAMKAAESAIYGWSGSTVQILNDSGEELWMSPIPAL